MIKEAKSNRVVCIVHTIELRLAYQNGYAGHPFGELLCDIRPGLHEYLR